MKIGDWENKNLDLIKEMLRQGELRVAAQVQLATSADQRATVLAGIYVAAATGIIGALATQPNILTNKPLFVGAVVAAILFLAGSIFSIWATIPVGFWAPGNDPEQWYADIDKSVSVARALGEQSEHYNDMISDNRNIIKRNATRFRMGAICGIAAPIAGIFAGGVTCLLTV